MTHVIQTSRQRNPSCRGLARSALLLCVVVAPGAQGAPLYLSPQLEGIAGTTSNRFLTPRAESSPYLQLAPALETVWFGPGDGETGAVLQHRTTRFTRPGFEGQDETSARVSLWQPLPAADLTIAAQGSVFRDRAVPTDDATWVQGTLGLRASPSRRVAPGLITRIIHTRFRSRTTPDGSTQRDLRWTLEPSLRWQVGRGETLWAGATLEGATSNDESDAYRGVGLSAGLDAQWHEAAAAGLWVRWNRRNYRATDRVQAEERSDNPVGRGCGEPWGWNSPPTSATWIDEAPVHWTTTGSGPWRPGCDCGTIGGRPDETEDAERTTAEEAW